MPLLAHVLKSTIHMKKEKVQEETRENRLERDRPGYTAEMGRLLGIFQSLGVLATMSQ